MELNEQLKKMQDLVMNKSRVCTIMGASFEGLVVGHYYNQVMRHYGVVVMATHEPFEGSVHVYPVKHVKEVSNV